MKNKDLEKIIKNKMLSYTHMVDTDQLWDSLSNHVPKKEKKRGFFYFQFAAILFVASLVLFYYSNNNLKNNPNKNLVSIENAPIEKNHNSIKQTKQETRETKIAEKNSINISSIEEKNKIQSQKLMGFTDIRRSNQNDFMKINTVQKSIKIEEPGKQEVLETNKINSNKLIGINIDKPDINTILKNRKLAINSKQIFIPKNLKKSIDIIPFLNILAPTLKAISPKNEVIALSPSLMSSKIFRDNNNSWKIGFRLGFFTQQMNVINVESESYADIYNKISSSKLRYGIDLGYQYKFNKNWYLSSGISWSNITTKLHPNWSKNMGGFNSVSGTTTVSKLEYESIAYQYINRLDLPIKLGYYLYQNHGLSLGLDLGPVINIIHNTQGKLLSESYKTIGISKSPYDTKFSVSVSYGIQFEYQIKRNIKSYIYPQITISSLNFNYNDINTNHNFRLYDIAIGMRFKI